MNYGFKPFDKKITDIMDRLTRDFAAVRTGRANAAILDGVMVESYGTRMPVSQVATITSDGPQALRVAPWDATLGKEIEKAITQANLGLSVGSDEKGVRVFFPEVTAERRAELIKLAKEKMEEARAHLRAARDEVWSEIQKMEREGTMPEDDKFRAKDDMQKRVDAANAKFDEMLERKEREIAS